MSHTEKSARFALRPHECAAWMVAFTSAETYARSCGRNIDVARFAQDAADDAVLIMRRRMETSE